MQFYVKMHGGDILYLYKLKMCSFGSRILGQNHNEYANILQRATNDGTI